MTVPSDFDDLITGALGERGSSGPSTPGDVGDVFRRARRHRVARRAVAGSCVVVLMAGGVTAMALRTPSSRTQTPAAADKPAVDAPACAEGEVRTAKGDVLLHDGQPFQVDPDQCVKGVELPSGGAGTCKVFVSSGVVVAGTETAPSTIVGSAGEGDVSTDLCDPVNISGACPPPPDITGVDAPKVTSVTGTVPPDVTSVEVGPAPPAGAPGCMVMDCTIGGPGLSGGPVIGTVVEPTSTTVVIAADGSTESDSGEVPSLVVQACAGSGMGGGVPIQIAPSTTSIEPAG